TQRATLGAVHTPVGRALLQGLPEGLLFFWAQDSPLSSAVVLPSAVAQALRAFLIETAYQLVNPVAAASRYAGPHGKDWGVERRARG
ncbi:MAG: hypothetical protein C4334_05835, partial [Pyrinomonas sp.]